MSNRKQRLDELRELLGDQEPRRIGELAAKFGVSHMTIRRDAEALSREGLVQLLHGAVVWKHRAPTGPSSQYRLYDARTAHRVEKESIARLAAPLIQRMDTVMLDAGSSAEALAWAVSPTCHATFITYSHSAFLALQKAEGARIILAGGDYDRAGTFFRGNATTTVLKSIRATKAFLSAGGVSIELGVTCSNAFEYELKRALMEFSIRRILLVDHSKIGHTESTFYADLAEFDTIITDCELPPNYEAYCRRYDVEVLSPSVPNPVLP